MNAKKIAVHLVQGMSMGLAQVVPGVSGSTIALILGIYTRFLDVLYGMSQVVKHLGLLMVGKSEWSDVTREWRQIHWEFALSLLGGMIIGIVGLSTLLERVLEIYPQYVYAFFFGLILASILIPWKLIQHPRFHHALVLLLSTIGWFVFFGLVPSQELQSVSLWYVFLGGALGVSGLILPGVSGAFILLLMGQYSYILGVLSQLLSGDLRAALPVGVFIGGMMVGFLAFVRILKLIIHKAEGALMAFLSGVLIASLQVMWPFFILEGEDRVWNPILSFSQQDLIWIVGMILLGFGLVKYLQKISVRI